MTLDHKCHICRKVPLAQSPLYKRIPTCEDCAATAAHHREQATRKWRETSFDRWWVLAILDMVACVVMVVMALQLAVTSASGRADFGPLVGFFACVWAAHALYPRAPR